MPCKLLKVVKILINLIVISFLNYIFVPIFQFMSNLMYKIIMVNLKIQLSEIEFEKSKRGTYKVYYSGVFLSRQSLICLNNKVLSYLYSLRVFDYVDEIYNPDFFQMSYTGLAVSLRFMLNRFVSKYFGDDCANMVKANLNE